MYFSKEILKTKNAEKKKLKRHTMKILVLESEYPAVKDHVISYCKEHTNAIPFLPEIKFHLF